MASIIPGYEYDIFISYRQKDNKYDGWVTEFVENLKKELDATFKEEISVYFDINPHNGLLETHDVDASLQNKLKCLIFIPIISRTYCDPKSFAWEHEFKAFIKQASSDRFGLKIKLSNGNVASRVLPVQIHEININDKGNIEKELEGVLRAVEFIYNEPGVNRPLRSMEEKPNDNLNRTIYRNQINKVALAIKDIIESMKLAFSPELPGQKGIEAKGIKWQKEIKIQEPLREDSIKSEIGNQKGKIKSERSTLSIKKFRKLISAIFGIIAILLTVAFILRHQEKIKWAEEIALPGIEQYLNDMNYPAAFNLVQKAGKYIPKDKKFIEFEKDVVSRLTILTDPPGTDVFIRDYSDTVGRWKNLGKTPIVKIEMPNITFYQLLFKKPGYENVMAVILTETDTVFRKLFRLKEIPSRMIYVEGFKEEETVNYLKEKNGFFIDRYEVTNKEFKKFVDDGGYRKPEYWKNEFLKEGNKLNWKEAMSFFKDKTGRLGPATWEGEDYPDGQEDYPVTGISWYEAAAYAEYVGKCLPTAEHWGSALGLYIIHIKHYFGSKILPLSNFKGKGTEPVGKFRGISCFGAYDMAGNVREWCWNTTPVGHIVRGGAWNDATYLYSDMSQIPSFDRSLKNGFRCAQYINREKIPESAFEPIQSVREIDYYSGERDYSKEKPAPDNIFTIYKNQFLYDSQELKAKVEYSNNSNKDWTIEKITFNSAYGKERMIAYLFLPKNVSPPYQTIIYWPGLDATLEKDLLKSGWEEDLYYLLKSGRAVMYPVYKGTFERNDEPVPTGGHQLTEWLIKTTKDFKRSIDYLETRSDIDKRRLGYYGSSWGGAVGAIVPAVEDRLAVSILIVGGFFGEALPEIDPVNYVSRVKIPTLMLNGRYDFRFNIDINVKPFFNLLGTPEKEKRLCVYETDHYVPKSEIIRETLDWLDKYFGQVNHLNK